MRKLFLIMLSAFIGLQGSAQFSKGSLQATGLTCAMCSNAVNKALLQVPFVESVRSDIKNSSFSIVFKKDAAINIDALKDAVEDAGFSVGSLKLTGNLEPLKVANDQHVQIGTLHFHFLGIGEQSLNGETTITVVDKNFISAKQFKKYSAATKMPCMQTGKAGSCCTNEGVTPDTRIYHVTI
jgi:copper chaperone CopZ